MAGIVLHLGSCLEAAEVFELGGSFPGVAWPTSLRSPSTASENQFGNVLKNMESFFLLPSHVK